VHKIYDIREDTDRVEKIERAGRSASPWGLVAEHGPFGSPEWWTALADGRIPLYTVNGVICRVYMTGQAADWAEFEIDAQGELSSWNCMTSGGPGGSPERIAKGVLYEVGRPVLLKYVHQRLQQALPGKSFVKTVLEIWIGDHRAAGDREPR